MLKNLTSLFHESEGFAFHFICDPNSPLPMVKDALIKFMAYVSQIDEQVKAQKAQQLAKPSEVAADTKSPEQPNEA